MKRIILASKSPRRKQLLENLKVNFDVIESDIEEKIDLTLSFEENVKNIALKKALNVVDKVEDRTGVIIAADTMVVHDTLIGKPNTIKEAYEILRRLSGKTHQVITGVCIYNLSDNTKLIDYKSTSVSFINYDDQLIWKYIKSGEVWDKAGAYGIQGQGALLVDYIEGCYFNVVGLPLSLLAKMLMKFDIPLI